jgi:hypothetical protein
MGTTAHHGFPVPAPTDEVRMVRVHIEALADAIDSAVPKVTYGKAGDPLPAGSRDGDIHLTYVDQTPIAPAPPPVPPAPRVDPGDPYPPTPAATPKRARKATG